MLRLILINSVMLLAAFSCQKKDKTNHYIFLGHPYDWNAPDRVDPRLASTDYSQYDQVWLGGDVCSHLTKREATLNYVDSIFDVSSPNTLWALGNHDVLEGNESWIEQQTKRPSFYTTWKDGICIMILNTNLFWYYDSAPPLIDCNKKQAHLKMIQEVTDTIENASHLIVLHHLALLSNLRRNELGVIPDSFNINPKVIRPSCDSNIILKEWMYPKLVNVQKRGIDVILVGGDFGMRAKSFQFYTKDSICLLGSGINNSLRPEFAPEYVTSFGKDKVLIFDHFPDKKELRWVFHDLDALIGSYGGN